MAVPNSAAYPNQSFSMDYETCSYWQHLLVIIVDIVWIRWPSFSRFFFFKPSPLFPTQDARSGPAAFKCRPQRAIFISRIQSCWSFRYRRLGSLQVVSWVVNDELGLAASEGSRTSRNRLLIFCWLSSLYWKILNYYCRGIMLSMYICSTSSLKGAYIPTTDEG